MPLLPPLFGGVFFGVLSFARTGSHPFSVEDIVRTFFLFRSRRLYANLFFFGREFVSLLPFTGIGVVLFFPFSSV